MHPRHVWARFDQSWRQEVGAECLRALRVFGYRQVWDETRRGDDTLVMFTEDDDHNFLADETTCEEGWATENQVSANSRQSC